MRGHLSSCSLSNLGDLCRRRKLLRAWDTTFLPADHRHALMRFSTFCCSELRMHVDICRHSLNPVSAWSLAASKVVDGFRKVSCPGSWAMPVKRWLKCDSFRHQTSPQAASQTPGRLAKSCMGGLAVYTFRCNSEKVPDTGWQQLLLKPFRMHTPNRGKTCHVASLSVGNRFRDCTSWQKKIQFWTSAYCKFQQLSILFMMSSKWTLKQPNLLTALQQVTICRSP